MILNVELNYLYGDSNRYNWIPAFISQGLLQLGIVVNTHISPYPLPTNILSEATNDGELTALLERLRQTSQVWSMANQRNEWYLSLTIGAYHIDQSLGKMYDTTMATDTRNGCAVFESEITKLVQRYSVPLKSIMGRTILHEIGHCLNLVHRSDLFIMSQTDDLIESPLKPRWYANIRFVYSQNDIDYIRNNPGQARPGGTLRQFSVSDRYKAQRLSDKLDIELLNYQFTDILQFTKGEIVSLCVKISNNTLKRLQLPMPLGQFSRNLRVDLYDPNGEAIDLQIKKGCGYTNKYAWLDPKEYKYISLNLHCNQEGYLFEKPGIYTIRCLVKKAKTKNTWYRSKLAELIIETPTVNEEKVFEKIYTKEFLQLMIGANPKSTKLVRQKNKDLKDEDVLNSNLLLCICWAMLSVWKNQIALGTVPKDINKAKVHLRKLYELLLLHESSIVKRGKIAQDYLELLNSFPAKGRRPVDINPGDIQAYHDFKLRLIGRGNHNENKKNYEEKLSIN